MRQRFTDLIKSSFDDWTVEYRAHATQRMFKRSIKEGDVK